MNDKERLNNKLNPNNSNNRERPHLGQSHTSYGERGKTEVKGITFRDLADAFVKACLHSSPQSEFYTKVGVGTWDSGDLFKMDWNQIDPMAIQQNLACEIERMMGIFPNVPELRHKYSKELEE